MATIFKPLGDWKSYYIPTGTEVPATDLRRARKVYRGLDNSCYKLASHKEDPTDTLYIWMIYSDEGAMTAYLIQDGADGLERAENEGIFEMRCDDLDLEGRALMAEIEAEFA